MPRLTAKHPPQASFATRRAIFTAQRNQAETRAAGLYSSSLRMAQRRSSTRSAAEATEASRSLLCCSAPEISTAQRGQGGSGRERYSSLHGTAPKPFFTISPAPPMAFAPRPISSRTERETFTAQRQKADKVKWAPYSSLRHRVR